MSFIAGTDDNFDTHVKEGLVLAKFYADWCGPCKMMSPVVKDIANEMNDLKVIEINIENCKETTLKYGVMSLPTMLIFKDGKQVGKSMGRQPKENLVQLINKHK